MTKKRTKLSLIQKKINKKELPKQPKVKSQIYYNRKDVGMIVQHRALEYKVSFYICIDGTRYMFIDGNLMKIEADQVEFLKSKGIEFKEIPF